jgi:Lysylphosphatidylglycerol synthase TM region
VNNLLPARAGDLVRIESLRSEERIPAFVVAGTLFAERLLDGLVLSGWIVAGALLLGTGGPLLLTGLALSAGSVLGLALVVLAAARPAESRRVARRALTALPRRWRGRVEQAALSFLDGLSTFRPGRTLVLALVASVPVWLADLGLYVALGQAFGIDAGLGGYLALEGVGHRALAVPSTAAAVGSFDYLTLLAAREIAAAGPATSAYVVALHVFTVVPVSLLGLAFVGRMLPRRRRVLAAEANPA